MWRVFFRVCVFVNAGCPLILKTFNDENYGLPKYNEGQIIMQRLERPWCIFIPPLPR